MTRRRLFIDIETIPTTVHEEMQRIAAGVIEHNATLAKPHSDEKVKALVDEAHRKTALDAALGEVVVISAALDDEAPKWWARDWRVPGSEAKMLAEFRDYVAALSGGLVAVGHNVNGFDGPFLRQRGLVHGIAFPGWLVRATSPWEATSRDTMLMWTGGAPGKTIGLDRLCRALGLPGKDGVDGSQVWDLVVEGRIADVATYCCGDVERTRACFRRMTDTINAANAAGV